MYHERKVDLRARFLWRGDGLGLGAAVGLMRNAAAVLLTGSAPFRAREAIVPVAVFVRPARTVFHFQSATLSWKYKVKLKILLN